MFFLLSSKLLRLKAQLGQLPSQVPLFGFFFKNQKLKASSGRAHAETRPRGLGLRCFGLLRQAEGTPLYALLVFSLWKRPHRLLRLHSRKKAQ